MTSAPPFRPGETDATHFGGCVVCCLSERRHYFAYDMRRIGLAAVDRLEQHVTALLEATDESVRTARLASAEGALAEANTALRLRGTHPYEDILDPILDACGPRLDLPAAVVSMLNFLCRPARSGNEIRALSHDMATPLSAMGGLLVFLADGSLLPRARENFALQVANVREMLEPAAYRRTTQATCNAMIAAYRGTVCHAAAVSIAEGWLRDAIDSHSSPAEWRILAHNAGGGDEPQLGPVFQLLQDVIGRDTRTIIRDRLLQDPVVSLLRQSLGIGEAT